MDILHAVYWNNTVLAWLTALVIALLSIMAGKLVYWLLATVLRRLTARTQSRLDDIIIDMIEEPLSAATIVAGIWFALSTLSLPAGLDRFVSNVMQFLIVMMIAWLASRLIDSLIREYLVPLTEKSENTLDDQLMPILRKGLKIVIWALAVIIGFNNAGYDVAALLAGLGVGGLALAMAAKDTVANVFGGFTIFVDQPFHVGDRIRVCGFDGTATEIGVRSTRLRTLDGRVVTIPNAQFADSPIENVSWEPSRKITLELGLTYDTSAERMEEAMNTIREIIAAHDATEEKTLVNFTGFGDSALLIKVIYYIRKGADIGSTQTDINLAILRRFNEAKLEFAYPTQMIFHQAV